METVSSRQEIFIPRIEKRLQFEGWQEFGHIEMEAQKGASSSTGV